MASLKNIYLASCLHLKCRANSALLRSLPDGCELRELDLSINIVGPKGMLPLLQVFRHAKGVVRINMDNNQLTSGVVEDICVFLEGIEGIEHSLKALSLAGNPIDSGAPLLRLVKKCRGLTEVNLQGTRISGGMLKNIEHYITRNRDGETRKSLVLGTGLATDRLPQLDLASSEAILSAVPVSVHPALCDDDPAPALLRCCEKRGMEYVDAYLIPGGGVRDRKAAEFLASPVLWPHVLEGELIECVDPKQPFQWFLQVVCEVASRCEETLRGLISPPHYNRYGVYSVRFHIAGSPRFVVVDDLVPCSEDGFPCHLRSRSSSNSLWFHILQRSVAKLKGGYASMKWTDDPTSVKPSPAMLAADWTGGLLMERW
eukprot:Sspe_Gene.57082::Locus_31343_Transcript_1_1_Confidence_1.000_Length_1193::g.57082::m.57082